MARPRKNAAASRASLPPEGAPLPEIPVREQPYPLPEGWKWVRLSSLCSLQNGKAFKPSDWSESGIPIVRIQNLNNENCKFNFYNGHIDNKFLLKSGDLLFAWSGTPGTSFGAHIWMRGKAVLNQHIFRIDFDEEVILKYFFKYAINCRLEELIIQAHGGAGLQHVTKGVFENTPIPLPPREEQERIVGHIESLFARLDEARQKAEAVRDSVALRRAAILHKAFTGELTAKWREEHNKPYTWETKKLKEICQKITDGTHHSPENSEIGDYMYVTAKNIKESGIDLSKITYIDKKTHAEIYSRCDVKFEDVLYIKDGATTGIATVNTLHEEFSLLSSVAVLRPKINILFPYFLAYSLNSSEVKSKMINNMSGNAITRLTLSKIKESSIAICALEEQQEIVRILDDLLGREQRLREAADAVVAHIERMKKAILARAFRGELGRADCPSRP